MPTISGTVKDASENFAERLVFAYRRGSGTLAGTALSNATTGVYSITVPNTSEHFVVAFDTGAGDPFFGQTVLQFGFDGANGSTTFVDTKGRYFSAVGNAQISTAQSVSGGASVLFDGTGDYITTSESVEDFIFGTGDFTVEFWVKTSDANACLLDFYTTGQNAWQVFLTPSGQIQWYVTSAVKTTTATVNNNAWRHVAVVRASGILNIFIDGVVDGAGVSHTTNLAYKTPTFSIGAQVNVRNATYDFGGNLDNLRITKGVARYTADFTPPTAAFSAVSGGTENAVILDRVVPV